MARFFEHFCRAVDRIAGVLIAAVTLLVVASAVGRYGLAKPIPDAFDISRLMIGACIIWGFAAVGYRGGHITVDLLAETLGPRGRRWLDAVSWTFLLLFVLLLSWKMLDRVASAWRSNEATFDLRIPVWPFLALIWLGVLAAIVTVSVRLVFLVTDRVDAASGEMERSGNG